MIDPKPVVLVIEDEKEIRRFVHAALEDDGCVVYEAETAAAGLSEAAARTPDLVVPDLGLPDRDGGEIISDLRGWLSAPIIILSARSDEDDKVEALDAGADDYLTKPFGVAELLARVRALLRRKSQADDALTPVVTFGEIRVDMSRRCVERNGQRVHLTPTEYRMLGVFISNTGRVLTHRKLLRAVWGAMSNQSNHYLRIYVAHLRRKLEIDPAQPQHILTETGVGYRFQS